MAVISGWLVAYPLVPCRPAKHDGEISVTQYHADLVSIIGHSQRYACLLSSWETSKNPFFHEACVFLPEHDELYITSSLLQSTSSSQLPSGKMRISSEAPGPTLFCG